MFPATIKDVWIISCVTKVGREGRVEKALNTIADGKEEEIILVDRF